MYSSGYLLENACFARMEKLDVPVGFFYIEATVDDVILIWVT